MVDWKNRIIETADMAVKDLKANPKNWRKHPQAQQNALTGVLDTVGWVAPVIWNKQTGHLIDGHLRLELAVKRKEKTLPVSVVDLSPEEEAMILATFDPIAAMAEADRQMLQGLMESIETEDEQIQALLESIAKEEKIDLGGEPAEAPEPQVGRAAELQEQWQTARGQLWQCGDHRVLCGDSTNAEDVARLMGGDTADLVLTDPPYGINRDKGFGGFGGFGPPIARRQYADEWDSDRPPKETFDLMLSTSRAAIIFGGNFFADLIPAGRHWLVWDKQNTMPTFGDCELAWTNLDRTSVKKYEFTYNGLIGKEKERFHPTQKPVGLFATILNDYSKPGESVLDPFLGSGTTLIACEQLGRRCFGMEISPAYTAVILERWHDMTGRDPVLLET